MEVLTNSDGERGISHIECDSPNESTDDLEASELDCGSWEFTVTVPAGFEGTEPVFQKFRRYRLAPEAIFEEQAAPQSGCLRENQRVHCCEPALDCRSAVKRKAASPPVHCHAGRPPCVYERWLTSVRCRRT
jgi:hypothetical protein